MGQSIDIIAGIYPSTLWGNRCRVLKIADIPLCLGVSRGNPLASRPQLSLDDLTGQTLWMIHRGDTSFIDELRNTIEHDHPGIRIQDVPSYDTAVFNQCATSNGIIYPLNPSQRIRSFIDDLWGLDFIPLKQQLTAL